MNRIKQARLLLVRAALFVGAASRSRRFGQRSAGEKTATLRLSKCDRGAVMVATLFMALFLIALLYMVIGLGRTLVMKEGMQDAADAAAYSSAIFNARGMNLIVFINLVMAALISVLIAIRVAQSFLAFIAGVLVAMSLASLGGAAAVTGPLATLATKQAMAMGKVYNSFKPVVETMLTALHNAQVATSVVVPFVSMTRGMVEAATHHEPAEGAFAIPGSFVLPVESDDYSRLCEEGAEYIVDLAFAAFPEPVQRLSGFVGEAAGGIANTTSAFLCGGGGGAAPTYSQTTQRVLPRHPDEADCEEEGSAVCLEMERYLSNAKPVGGSGDCRAECEYSGPYETMARRARVDCEPRIPYHQANYEWQERMVDAEFTFDGAAWRETSRSAGPPLHKTHPKDPPCGFGGTVNDGEWERDSGPSGATEPLPLCREKLPDLMIPGRVNDTKRLTYKEVVRIFSCSVPVTQTIELASSDQAMGGSGSESRSPHKLEKDVELGDEAFQIRAIAFGPKPDPGNAKQGVVLVNRGEGNWQKRWEQARPAGEGFAGEFVQLASEVGRFTVAQAEFYFDTSAGEDSQVERRDFMWEMKWTARLRHFHLPTAEEKQQTDERNQEASGRVSQFGGIEPGSSTAGACAAAGGDECESGVAAVSLLDEIVRH